MKANVQVVLQPYWSLRNEIAIIDGIPMKVRRIIIPASLQNKVLSQLQLNHAGIEKARLWYVSPSIGST